jgi:sporulation protein YlmC with PRC-barrel domain
MIAAELRGDNRPSLNEALGWIGSRVDDIYGVGIGRLEDVWIDPGTGEPRWLLIKEGRFGGRATLIPFEDATAGAGHVWVPYEREVIRDAPAIEPGAPLTQQVEHSLRRHYAANSPAAFERAEQLGRSLDAEDGEGGESSSESRRSDSGRGRPAAEGSAQGEGTGSPPPPPGWAPPYAQPSQPWPPHPGYYAPPPPYGYAPYGYAGYPPYPYPPQPPFPQGAPYGYAAAPEAPADPLAALEGRDVEIELEGPVTISGRVRSVRVSGEGSRESPSAARPASWPAARPQARARRRSA